MGSGFSLKQFRLLRQWEGQKRNNGDKAQNDAYTELFAANRATSEWAEALCKSEFPNGRVKKQNSPLYQSQKFKPYTWTRIYPFENAPSVLAYTVGIDASGIFCVKIDVVNPSAEIQRDYNQITGGDHFRSPVAGILSEETGLSLTLDGLLDWSTEQIEGFELSYYDLSIQLGLTQPRLRSISDASRVRQGFVRWRDAMLGDAVTEGGIFASGDSGVVFSMTPSDRPVACKLGLDPTGSQWAVEINETSQAEDGRGHSAIAETDEGSLVLLRQGRLHGRRGAPGVSLGSLGDDAALKPAFVEGAMSSRSQSWYIVAALDDPPGRIRRDTARFVVACWSARPDGRAGGQESAETDVASKIAGGEQGGEYLVSQRSVLDPKVVRRLHAGVWNALTTRLSEAGIDYKKYCDKSGFEIDLVVCPQQRTSVLIEIKTTTSASDLHGGIGQLMLYPELMPEVRGSERVLLLDRSLPSRQQKAVERIGIQVHTYRRPSWHNDEGIEFTPEFLLLCGISSSGT